MKKVYIVAARRSPIGSFLGTLSQVSPKEFASVVLKETLNDAKISPELVDEVIIGNVLQAGQKQGLARQIAIHSHIPVGVPAYSVNMVCGSGMKTIMLAYANILAGLHDIVVAGGVESMSQAPFFVSPNIRNGIKMGNQELKDSILHDGLTDAFKDYHMGITAENIVEKYKVSREEQEKFAMDSQLKAIKAQDENLFAKEIVPITIKTRKAEIVFDKDEFINRTTSIEKMASLRPAFKPEGTVTAATSSGINDGASFVIVASEDAVKKYNLTPLVEITSIAQAGVDPSVMGLGPTKAIKDAIKHANLTIKDIDLIELNEAFAAQSLGVIKELENELKEMKKNILAKTNIKGGAIALGHPLGASGNRIVVTLIHSMLERKDAKYGLASLCIGGGMGTALVLKKVEGK